jgi:transcriptional regulator with XRE-family HTH domain
MYVYVVQMPNTTIPEWTLTDRMAKAMRAAGKSPGLIAEEFGVHRNTVSGWLHGRIKPSTTTLRLWAVTMNVPYEWLINGDEIAA